MNILIFYSALQVATGPQWSPLAEADMALAQEINQIAAVGIVSIERIVIHWLL